MERIQETCHRLRQRLIRCAGANDKGESEEMTEKKQGMVKLFEIDYSKMPDNTCTIKTISESNQKVAVCKEQGKIKVFPVEGE
jgi:hypothetical protein